MSSVYFDTSAFVKILIQEPGSGSAVRAWRAADSVSCSRLLPAEARAALAMARRQRRLSNAQQAQAKAALEAHWQDVFVVEVTERVVEDRSSLTDWDQTGNRPAMIGDDNLGSRPDQRQIAA